MLTSRSKGFCRKDAGEGAGRRIGQDLSKWVRVGGMQMQEMLGAVEMLQRPNTRKGKGQKGRFAYTRQGA